MQDEKRVAVTMSGARDLSDVVSGRRRWRQSQVQCELVNCVSRRRGVCVGREEALGGRWFEETDV